MLGLWKPGCNESETAANMDGQVVSPSFLILSTPHPTIGARRGCLVL